jgi:hypothetical protein
MRLALSALVLFACAEPPDPRAALIDSRRPDAIRLVEKLDRILDHAAKQPALTRPIPLDPPLDVQWIHRASSGASPHWNALVIHDHQRGLLRKPGDRFSNEALWFPPDPFTFALQVTYDGIDDYPFSSKSSEEIGGWFDALARLEYVVVLHDDVYAAPIASGSSFQPGRYVGEARVYRIADGIYLGGFRFGTATQTSWVQTHRGRESTDVAVDFDKHAWNAFGTELARHFPGSRADVR